MPPLFRVIWALNLRHVIGGEDRQRRSQAAHVATATGDGERRPASDAGGHARKGHGHAGSCRSLRPPADGARTEEAEQGGVAGVGYPAVDARLARPAGVGFGARHGVTVELRVVRGSGIREPGRPSVQV